MNKVSNKVALEKVRLHSDRIVRIGAVNAALKKYWDEQEAKRAFEELARRRDPITLPAPPPWEEITAVGVPGGRR